MEVRSILFDIEDFVLSYCVDAFFSIWFVEVVYSNLAYLVVPYLSMFKQTLVVVLPVLSVVSFRDVPFLLT